MALPTQYNPVPTHKTNGILNLLSSGFNNRIALHTPRSCFQNPDRKITGKSDNILTSSDCVSEAALTDYHAPAVGAVSLIPLLMQDSKIFSWLQ